MAYRIVFTSYIILTSIPILLMSYFLDIIPFMIISSVLVNELRRISFGFHLTNGKCFILTLILISAFGYVAKNSETWVLFLISIFCMKDIYINSPLKLTVKNKDLKWHEDRITLLLGIYLALAVIGVYLELDVITNSILCSIIMVDATLFINKTELRKETKL